MEVTAGFAKGMRVRTPEGLGTRPTSARVREAVFNMLSGWIEDALVLDLFAGSGALGLEALSRGAAGAVFVEQDRRAVQCIKDNAAELLRRAAKQGLAAGTVEVVHADVRRALTGSALGAGGARFGLVFMDPPYRDVGAWVESAPTQLAPLTIVGARWVLETAKGEKFSAGWTGPDWSLVKDKTYGDTMIWILERTAGESRGP